MAGLFNFPPFDETGSTGFLDPALAYQAQASLLGKQGAPQPAPQQSGMSWGGGSNLWPMLMSLGAGIASGGAPGGGGWGGGIGKGLALAQEQQRLMQNDDFKKLALGLQLRQAEALEGYRGAQLAQGAERNRLYEQSVNKPRPRSYAVNPNTGQLYDTTTGDPKEGTTAGTNPYYSGKMNEVQGKTATFVDRMAKSHDVITSLESINTTDNPISTGATAVLPQGYANLVQSKDRQKVVQAERDFINAALRRESGAAISPSEFENARLQYFPQIGDGPDVLAQKRQNRVIVMQGLAREAGPNYTPPQIGGTQQSSTDGVLDYNEYFGR